MSKMLRLTCSLLITAALVVPVATNARNTSDGGGRSPITISDDCQLLKDGLPYRGVGVNYYDALYRTQRNDKDRSYVRGLRALAAADIPFVRFQVLPYWPSELKPFIDNPDLIFDKMDPFVQEAEANHIGLVPSVFFNFRALPDALNEPTSAWGDPDSKTSRFAKLLAEKLASHYKDSSAIWFWEFSNEINDWADFSTAYKYVKADESKGTPKSYGPRDAYSTADMVGALGRFRDAIHLGDPTRLVEAGYNLPRNGAYHLARGISGRSDSVAEFARVVEAQNGPADLASFHVYPHNLRDDFSRRFSDHPVDAAEFIGIAADVSQKICKPMFLGEFSADSEEKYTDPVASEGEYQEMLDAFESSKAPLAAMWAFELPWHDGYTVSFDNARSARLRMLTDLNHRLRSGN